MAKTKTPKPRPARQERSPLPPYIKPWQEFRKAVQVGDEVTLHRRIYDSGWTMKEVSGTVREVATNCVVLNPRVPGIPWYAIHDWEIN